MLGFFVVVLALLLVGEITAQALMPIIPGPLVGMVLLLAILAVRGGVPTSFEAPATALIAHLTLFILPVSLGILEDYTLLAGMWLTYGGVIVAGSLVTGTVTALVAGALLRRRGAPPPRRRPPDATAPR